MKSRKSPSLNRDRVEGDVGGGSTRRRSRGNATSIAHQPLGAALCNSAIGVAVTNGEGRFLLVNEVFCRITGYKEEELLSRDWSSIVHPDDGTENGARAWRLNPDQPSGVVTENRCERKDGAEIWMRSSISALQQRRESPLFIALIEDITERKRAERAVAEQESELKEAQRLGQIGSWQWNPATDAVIWSDDLYRFTGRDPKLPAPSFRQHSIFFTPDSWKRLVRSVRKTQRTGTPYELQLQVVRPDGTCDWVTARGEAVRNGSGRIVRLRGTIQNITASKRAEEALLESEEKFITAFNAVPVAVTVTTAADGRQVEVNEALLQMTGYTRDEVIGRTFLELGYWDDPGDRKKLVDRLLAGEHLRNVDCRFRRRNGEPFTGLLSAELIELHGEQCIVTAAMDVTNLRRTEEALRSSQKRAALYFQQTIFAVVEWDRQFRVVQWNPAAEVMFGYTRAEALGRTPGELIVPSEIVPEVSETFKALLDQTGGQRSVNVNTRRNGERIVCEWFNTPLVAEDGEVIGVISLAHDITAHKQAQSQLAASQAIMSAVVESTDDMIWVVDPERFGLTMFNTGLARYFAQNRQMQISVGMTPDELLPTPSSRELWKSFYRRALAKGSFRQEYEVAAGTHILDLSFYPLVSDGCTFGISVFGKDVTVSRRTRRALQASEDRYRNLVESSNDWVWEVDRETRYTYVGPQCRDILGYEPEEILGRTPFDFMSETEARRVAEAFAPIAAGRKPFRTLENSNIHKDGHLVVLETNGTPIFDEAGNLVGYRGMDRDITERKRAEVALRDSEEKYRTLADNLPAVLFQFYARNDKEWGVYFVHENSRDLLGIEAQPFYTWGERVASCLEPEDVRRGVESIQQAIASFSTWDFETKFIKPTGEEVYIRGMSKPRRQGDELVFHGIVLDITPRKRAERALRESEERLRMAAQVSRMYAFEWNPTTDVVVRSAECMGILGVKPDTLQVSGNDFMRSMHPADREQYLRAVKMLTPDEPSFRASYRFVRSDGLTVWLEDHVRAIFNDGGLLMRTIGMTVDITARKEAERALNELSGRLINAQEEERKRVARELHDGVSQSLAVIAIEMAQAADAAAESAVNSKLEKLYAKVQSVLADIGRLSHELHPSTLTHLGLSAAIRVLCEEITQTYGVDVEYSDKSAPQPSSKESELCLYRVAQESLRNIVKHSGSKQAWVELGGNEGEIRLAVWDQGVGFDAHGTKAGLGLVSMRERLRIVGGRIAINSRRGSGTRIEAYVPLRCEEFQAAA